jgi:hypothetical protein
VEAVAKRKRARATEVLAGSLGVSWDDVVKYGQSHPSDPTWAEAWKTVRAVGLNADLIIATFTDDEVAIITIEHTGKITWVDHYAAMGSGSSIASVVLHQRDYSDYMDFDSCLYRVLEAKLAAERDPYVGRKTILGFADPTGFFALARKSVEAMAETIQERLHAPVEAKWDFDGLVAMRFSGKASSKRN